MRKIATFGILGLLLVSLAAIGLAYRGDPTVVGPNYDAERHDAMLEAFENKDYNTWYSLMSQHSKGRILDVINADNFEKFAEMREAMLNGEDEKANEIRAELGLGTNNGFHKGFGHRHHRMGNRANFIDENNDGICDNLQ